MKAKEESAGRSGRIRWNMLLTGEEAAFLKEQARREGRSASELVRSAIERIYRPYERLEPLRALTEIREDYLDRNVCFEELARISGGRLNPVIPSEDSRETPPLP